VTTTISESFEEIENDEGTTLSEIPGKDPLVVTTYDCVATLLLKTKSVSGEIQVDTPGSSSP
jgi:hypothetical protein